jgi:hypothetical protein
MSQDTESTEQAVADELIPRLRVIEQQPISERAPAYAALHDELARHLESGPTG